MIRRHRLYFAVATISLALCVGANLAVFTIVNALWLRPLAIPHVDRLVTVSDDATGSTEGSVFGGLEDATRWGAFEAVAGQVTTSGAFASLRPHLIIDQVGHEVETIGVTSQYFRLLGQEIHGRDFTRADNRSGAEPVAIISERFWSRAFGRRLDAIGAIAGAKPFPIRIVGVAPANFEGARRGEHTDVWIPSNLVPRMAPAGVIPEDGVPGIMLARLHGGQTTADAERRLIADADNAWVRRTLEHSRVIPLMDVFGTPDARTIVISRRGVGTMVVGGLAALILVAGCASLMMLVVVHYERRRRELAVRIALGASRSRLTFQLFRELGCVATGGLCGAGLVASWSLRALPALTLPGGVELGRLDLSVDWRVVGASLSITALTLVLAALIPISRFTRVTLAGQLIAPGSTTSRSSQRLRQILLALHVCATIIVLVAAGLFVRTVAYGFSVGPGFDVDRTLYVAVQVVPPFMTSDQASNGQRAQTIQENTRRLMERLVALPSVEEVAMGPAPIGPDQAASALVPKRVKTEIGIRELPLGIVSGSPELLRALGVPIVKGRTLTETDGATTPAGAVITGSLARALWGASDPIGQKLSAGFREGRYTVVGVAADFVYGSLTQQSAGVLVTVDPKGYGGMEPRFVVRSERPNLLVEPIRGLVQDILPEVPRLVTSTGHDIVARDLGRQRLGAYFFTGFGLVALMLGAVGVFGLVAYLAESRGREFGVLLALGATSADLLRRGVISGMGPVSIGTAFGIFLAAFVSRVFASLLPGLSALDPLTYVGVAILVIGFAAAASLGGAWRLRRIAPSDALRAE